MKSQVAFITGGTKGIGFGIAEALLSRGVKVAFTGRSEKSVKEAVYKLQDKGTVSGIVSDVRNYDSLKNAVTQTIGTFGKIDVLVANAGLTHFVPVDEMTVEQWDEVIQTNLSGVFYSLRACANQLKQNKGYFITIASLAGTNFFKKGSAYNASKFGVTGFTQAAMLDLRSYGVKSTVIMPGSVSTNFNGHTPNNEDSWKIQPEDIGKLVLNLLEMDERTLPSKIEVRPSFPPAM